MDLIITKLLVAFLFGLIRYLFGILPIIVHTWLTYSCDGKTEINERKRQTLDSIVAMIQSFGGGVLYATCFLHMMPELNNLINDLKKFSLLQSNYPYSQLVISLGFFTIYFSEELSNWLISRKPKHGRDEVVKTPLSTISDKIDEFYITTPNKYNGMAFEVLPIETKLADNDLDEKMLLDNFSCDLVVDTTDQCIQTEFDKQSVVMEANLDLDPDVNAEIEEMIEEGVTGQQQVWRCILMVMALSLHAFFEGLAIGLQRSNKNIWYLFTAVSIHSATILFLIGSEIVMAGASVKRTLIHMFMLASTSPVGVLLGLIITLTTNLETSAKSFAIVLLEGLSTGTILYITFFETLSREKERRKSRIKRAVFILAGFALMAVLQNFTIHE